MGEALLEQSSPSNLERHPQISHADVNMHGRGPPKQGRTAGPVDQPTPPVGLSHVEFCIAIPQENKLVFFIKDNKMALKASPCSIQMRSVLSNNR